MPVIYSSGRFVNQATNATGNTESTHYRYLTGATRGCTINYISAVGKASAATTISGISFRIKRWTTTTSTGGTALTPSPRDQQAQAAITGVSSDATAITAGTGGPAYQGFFGCGKAGPGGWWQQTPDNGIFLPAGGGVPGNADVVSASAEVSLNFEMQLEHAE